MHRLMLTPHLGPEEPHAPQTHTGSRSINLLIHAVIPALTLIVAIGGGVFLWTTGMTPVRAISAATATAPYGGMGDRKWGMNAMGGQVGPQDFAGQYLWVEYSAPWCGHCPRQAAETRKLHQALGDRIAIVTVLTSEQVMQPATINTARQWARRHRLDERSVIAGSQTSMAVPQHRLFGPNGELLYSGRGLHSSGQMITVIGKNMRRDG